MLTERQSKFLFFPWTAQKNAQPLDIQHASGSILTLQNKRQVLDFSSHIFNAHLGHGHPTIRKAIIDHAERAIVPHPHGVYEERAKLAENLARISPSGPYKGLVKSFICLSGAEANENAIKMARLVTGRTKVVTRYRSYHGATLAALSYSGDFRRLPFDGSVNGIVRIPALKGYEAAEELALIQEVVEQEDPSTIACFLVESVTGVNGVIAKTPQFWKGLREICDRQNILLITDEVMTGFGRTGKWFGIEHFGITPDMMTMAKGITGGYAPLGAVVVNDFIAEYFEHNILWCGLTHYAHPLTCAIANAAIQVLEEEHLIENAARLGEKLGALLRRLRSDCSQVIDVRSIGLLAAIELRPDAISRDTNAERKLYQALLDEGVLCKVRANTILIAPPLNIPDKVLETGVQKITAVLSSLNLT